ncbi:hypothetical protein BDN71DRAFT_1521686 [Pleurotus eryngii]|uniref:Uncharacterized protein n=1 Tax=Pleurotus eryngii TaxID=5323 RepID=A0A9P5ZNP7_PLEER|nr:hypothetical protein BDN71DRAFT_1521686 [Pleurotus eryngii]
MPTALTDPTCPPAPAPAPTAPLPQAVTPPVVGQKDAFIGIGKDSCLVVSNTPTASSLTYALPLVPPMILDPNGVPIDSVRSEGSLVRSPTRVAASLTPPAGVTFSGIDGLSGEGARTTAFDDDDDRALLVALTNMPTLPSDTPRGPKPAAYPIITETVTEMATIVSLPTTSTFFVTKMTTVTSTFMGASMSTLTATMFTTETATLTHHWNKFIRPDDGDGDGDGDGNGNGDTDLGEAVGPLFMPGNTQLN